MLKDPPSPSSASPPVQVANSAWIRLGLFGSGFGVDIDNKAEALA